MHSNRAGLNSFRFISAICHSKFLDSARNPYINANSIVLSYYVNLHMTEFPQRIYSEACVDALYMRMRDGLSHWQNIDDTNGKS